MPGAADRADAMQTQRRPGPLPGFPAGRPQDWLRHQAAQRHELVVVGAHGGAGATTLAILLRPAWDMGAMRPGRDARYPALVAHGRPLLLVCRNTTAAAAAATAAAAALLSPGAAVSVLVVVSDGWSSGCRSYPRSGSPATRRRCRCRAVPSVRSVTSARWPADPPATDDR